jgi:hypothetical protein
VESAAVAQVEITTQGKKMELLAQQIAVVAAVERLDL